MKNTLFMALLVLSFPGIALSGVAIPRFTPNVVDPNSYLSMPEVNEINAAFEVIRTDEGVLPAVYIVDTLNGETIENVAERAFRQWELGEKGKDNGLLLVLAIKDRKSRFEVGYGLEGEYTDLRTKHALDQALAPKMREGKIREAILDSFNFLMNADVSTQAEFLSELPDDNGGLVEYPETGFKAWIMYVLFLLGIGPVSRATRKYFAHRLQNSQAGFGLSGDPTLDLSVLPKLDKKYIFIILFLTINPGAFIFIGGSTQNDPTLIYRVGLVILAISAFFICLQSRRYFGVDAYKKWIENQRKIFADKVAKGYAYESKPGHFQFTPAWYSSSEYKASQRSFRSSSNSRSSSSGGGRSGGGGSSSSW